MKTCPTCGREYAETTTLCPADGAVLKRAGNEDRLIGQVLAGKYRIEDKIDEGGMGCVYRATHVLMEKVIAVKVLHPALAADDKIVARFTREAKAASRISHPHAINVTDFGESENGVVYLVMEYLRGRTLKDIVRSGGPMTLARTTEIVRQVAGALDAAHAEGVVHRDLKSDNIMLDEATGGDWAKVLDFGIAKIQQTERDIHETDPGLTAPNLIIGTPQYMSPEQCSQASDIDARSDIYSFGVIIYEMLVGHVPFTGDSPTAIMMKHIQDAPPSILDERPDLPAEVGRVVARSLAKRPEDRFQTAGELSLALTEAAAAAPLTSAAAAAILDTERIGSPTSPNEPARTTVGRIDDDDATVVSANYARTGATGEALPPPIAPLPEPAFNPWRIAVPAIAVVAIVFAIFFVFQRRGVSSEQQPGQQPPLQADPNGQPVQPISPPTGQAERNLSTTPGAPTPATPAGGVTGALPGTTNANVAATPTPEAGKPNANQNGQPGVVVEPDGDAPTPTPTPKRNKRLEINANVDAPPPAAPPKEDKPKEDKPKEDKPKEDKPPKADDGPPGPVVKPL
ncbi:MAG: eukaryotic-like serine/threonine-protein kinase [Acidobacteriota bacterium]|jgi:serine/threonine-protein kinase|nr:eukaryotic-like serine/threonine-protein kinase [Acidobacteriota bacterium]